MFAYSLFHISLGKQSKIVKYWNFNQQWVMCVHLCEAYTMILSVESWNSYLQCQEVQAFISIISNH